MLRRTIFALLLLAATPAFAKKDLLGRPIYGPLTILRSIGYHDHLRSDGTTSVEATSFAPQGEGFASRMALYRAAELAHSQGHRYIQLLKSRVLVGTGLSNRGVEQVSLIVRFADDETMPADCPKTTNPFERCRVFDGALVMLRLAAEMDQPVPAAPADLKPELVPTKSGAPWDATALVRFTIDEQGQASDCRADESTAPEALTRAACASLIKSHFVPQRAPDGHPVRAEKAVRFRWRIDTGKPLVAPPLATTPVAMPASAKPVVPARSSPEAKKIYPADDTIQTPL